MQRDFTPTVADLDAAIEDKRGQLNTVRSELLAKRRDRDRIEAQLRILEQDRTRVTAELGDLERARDALAKVARVTPLTPPVTMPVEGPANDSYKLLGRAIIRSESNRTKFYTVEVRLYGQRIVLTCDCARFTFTRGEYANGRKAHCKHINTFKTQNTDWREGAARTARAVGTVGRIIYSEGVYDYECVVRGTRNSWHRRVTIS